MHLFVVLLLVALAAHAECRAASAAGGAFVLASDPVADRSSSLHASFGLDFELVGRQSHGDASDCGPLGPSCAPCLLCDGSCEPLAGACACPAMSRNSSGALGGLRGSLGCQCDDPLRWGADCAQSCSCAQDKCDSSVTGSGCAPSAAPRTSVPIAIGAASLVALFALCAIAAIRRSTDVEPQYVALAELRQTNVETLPDVAPREARIDDMGADHLGVELMQSS